MPQENEVLSVSTDAVLIGGKEIKTDAITVYDLTLTDNKTYSVMFDLSYESPVFQIVLETCERNGYKTCSDEIHLYEIQNQIVSCVETDRKTRSVNLD